MIAYAMLQQILAALGAAQTAGDVEILGARSLRSRYPVSDLACATVGAAASMLAACASPHAVPMVQVDRALASWWFGYSLKPVGWSLPAVRAVMTGDYRAQNGWIRIHANARHHRERACTLLKIEPDAPRAAIAARVQSWDPQALEEALVGHGACAAALRRPLDWRRHPQGEAVAAEPLIHQTPGNHLTHSPEMWADVGRPLAGIRVLDLTRVLAGPVATRFLAAYGARVLRLDPSDWDEPGMVPEVTAGKRCALLDLRSPAGRRQFEHLLTQADVLVHGYRPGALEGLGLGATTRQAIRPGLVDVSLSAWGWSGPWRSRRGFDSLVQMSTGIAWPGDRDVAPDPLPVQALDQATGYLMAACALRGLCQARQTARGSIWRVSLARTALLLSSAGGGSGNVQSANVLPDDAPVEAYDSVSECTVWGPARRLLPPCRVGSTRWSWDRGAVALRSDAARF